MDSVRMLRAGELGLVVEFGNEINPAINRRVCQIGKMLNETKLAGILEVVPTYRSLLVYFDPLEIERKALIAHIQQLLAMGEPTEAVPDEETRTIEIPVCYGGEFGPDMDFVACHSGLLSAEVAEIHAANSYLIYMLGFTPCHPYMGGVSERIATPRLEKPRTVVPVGSVGIGGPQTVVYPIESPGGMRLIGRTPLRPFDPSAKNPFLFAAGDYLKFRPITKEEYWKIDAQVTSGTYAPHIEVSKKVVAQHD